MRWRTEGKGKGQNEEYLYLLEVRKTKGRSRSETFAGDEDETLFNASSLDFSSTVGIRLDRHIEILTDRIDSSHRNWTMDWPDEMVCSWVWTGLSVELHDDRWLEQMEASSSVRWLDRDWCVGVSFVVEDRSLDWVSWYLLDIDNLLRSLWERSFRLRIHRQWPVPTATDDKPVRTAVDPIDNYRRMAREDVVVGAMSTKPNLHPCFSMGSNRRCELHCTSVDPVEIENRSCRTDRTFHSSQSNAVHQVSRCTYLHWRKANLVADFDHRRVRFCFVRLVGDSIDGSEESNRSTREGEWREINIKISQSSREVRRSPSTMLFVEHEARRRDIHYLIGLDCVLPRHNCTFHCVRWRYSIWSMSLSCSNTYSMKHQPKDINTNNESCRNQHGCQVHWPQRSSCRWSCSEMSTKLRVQDRSRPKKNRSPAMTKDQRARRNSLRTCSICGTILINLSWDVTFVCHTRTGEITGLFTYITS